MKRLIEAAMDDMFIAYLLFMLAAAVLGTITGIVYMICRVINPGAFQ